MCSFSNFCFKPGEPLLAFKQLVLMACPVILQNSCTDEAGAGLLAKFCSRRLSIDCRCFCHRFSSFPLNKFSFFSKTLVDFQSLEMVVTILSSFIVAFWRKDLASSFLCADHTWFLSSLQRLAIQKVMYCGSRFFSSTENRQNFGLSFYFLDSLVSRKGMRPIQPP